MNLPEAHRYNVPDIGRDSPLLFTVSLDEVGRKEVK